VAITLRNPGSWAAVNANTQTVTLPTHQTGDMLLVRAGMKHATLPGDITCATSGWARVGQHNSGTGASSNGGGDVQVAVFWKIATSGAETNPVVTFHASTNATPGCAVAMAYQKGAGEGWVTPVGAGGSIAAATSYSATMVSHISATTGDLLDSFAVTNDNTTLTSPTVSQASLTLNAVTESPAAALSDATSNDISADGCYRTATAGTSSAAAVASGTNSVADVGAAFVTRLRVEIRTDAAAGNAAATGASNNPTATVSFTAGSASATGAALQAAANVQPPAGNAAATGAAYDATVTAVDGDPPAAEPVDEVGHRVFSGFDESGVTTFGSTTIVSEAGRFVLVTAAPAEGEADAGLASGTGAAYNASVSVQPSAGHAAATGAANAAAVNVQPNAGNAAATGAAYGVVTDIKATAGHAAGTGAAYDATVSTATADTADAGEAAATGAAYQPSVSVATSAGNAAATGAAHQATTDIKATAGSAAATGAALGPSADIKATAGHAAATGAAYNATVSTAAYANADAGVATATGAAHQSSASVKATAAPAAATGAANQPSTSVAASPGSAAATGAANQPSPSVAVNAGSAAATGEAHDATVQTTAAGQALAGLAEAIAAAWDATVSVVESATPQRGGSYIPLRRHVSPKVFAHAGHATATAVAHGATTRREEDEGWLYGLPNDEHLLLGLGA
jgi:hypothetical protein